MADQHLVKNGQGTELIMCVWSNLLEQGRELPANAIETITGQKLVSLYTDVST